VTTLPKNQPALGVHPAATDAAKPPPYVRRDVHESLGEALTAGGLVIIEGRSAAGKSRLAFEAIQAFASDRWLIVPATPQALKDLLKAEVLLRRAVVKETGRVEEGERWLRRTTSDHADPVD
jgi:chloramphenicol 3-O-phosphotransferase